MKRTAAVSEPELLVQGLVYRVRRSSLAASDAVAGRRITMRIIGSSAMSRDVLWRVSGPALGCRNRLSLRSGPATSLLAQNRAKSEDSWVSRAGRAHPDSATLRT
jgi:hypothetical protein